MLKSTSRLNLTGLNAGRTVSLLLIVVLVLLSPSTVIASSLATPALGPRIGEGNNKSLNWSGYAVTDVTGSVSSVSGSWIVPTVKCAKGTTYAAFWAGIDGFNSNTVEQAGVLEHCSSGVASYAAWYEFYPNPSVTINSVTVSPGDKVSVSVTYSNGIFTITLTDGAQSYTTQSSLSGAARSSAECITERPSIGGSITKLADFGTVSFGQGYTGLGSTCYATVNGVSVSFGSFGSALQEITMVDNRGRILAQPSAISGDGSSFTETWFASS